MNTDKSFTFKIATCNAIGFLITSVGITLVDAKVKTYIGIHGARNYPLGFWISIGAPILFFISVLPIQRLRNWKAKAVWPSLCLFVIGSACLLNFRPGFPHTGFSMGIILFCFFPSLLLGFIIFQSKKIS